MKSRLNLVYNIIRMLLILFYQINTYSRLFQLIVDDNEANLKLIYNHSFFSF